jgi:hypothetical protein
MLYFALGICCLAIGGFIGYRFGYDIGYEEGDDGLKDVERLKKIQAKM